MKCTNCGSELKDTDKFCGECGKVQESDEVIYIDKTKSNKGLIITIIILGIIILAGTGIGVWLLLTNNDSEKKENNTSKNNTEDIVIIDDEEDKEIYFMNYKFNIPEGYKAYKTGSNNYIQNRDCMIMFVSYPLTYDQIITNKDLLMEELSKQGYKLESFEPKEIDNKKYIFVVGSMNNIECGFVFNELDSDTNVFITITSNYLGNFNESWFDDAIELLKSAVKENQ